jgi:hypothetical protein
VTSRARSYPRCNQSAAAIVESDVALVALGVIVVGGLAWLLYDKASEAATAAVNAVQEGWKSLPSLPNVPGTGVPFTPNENNDPPSLDTEPGFP